MLRYLLAHPAGLASLIALVGCFATFCFVCWYVAVDRRKARTDHIARLALEDGSHD